MQVCLFRNNTYLAELLESGEEGGVGSEEVVRLVVEAGGVEEAGRVAREHGAAALRALEGWQGEGAEELRGVVDTVLGQAGARWGSGCGVLGGVGWCWGAV